MLKSAIKASGLKCDKLKTCLKDAGFSLSDFLAGIAKIKGMLTGQGGQASDKGLDGTTPMPRSDAIAKLGIGGKSGKKKI